MHDVKTCSDKKEGSFIKLFCVLNIDIYSKKKVTALTVPRDIVEDSVCYSQEAKITSLMFRSTDRDSLC